MWLFWSSNDLVELSPQTVGSELESLVRELYEIDSVQFVVVGQVLRRHTPTRSSIIVRWASFTNIFFELYLPDGVHLNNLGNYKFMRSIRGAVLQALKLVVASTV